jgi:diguanylate cyclase (GGDEF)-like protein
MTTEPQQVLRHDHPSDGPDVRDARALDRDAAASHRDDAAVDRNMQADLRDVAAARRDELADDLLATAITSEQLLDLYLNTRQAALAHRSRASADRRAEAEDRHAAERDRHDAAVDRQGSATERHGASLDPLTGAYTRASGFRHLHRDIDSARRAQQSLTLAFLDVDGLKAINDADGHAAGDRALVQVVAALRTHLRPHDLIMRFGGDEFLCALTAVSPAEVEERIAQVSSALAHGPEQVTITVGLATLESDETIDELFRRADAAFYDTRKRR